MAKVPMDATSRTRESGSLLLANRMRTAANLPNTPGAVGIRSDNPAPAPVGPAPAPTAAPTAAPSFAPTYADPMAGFDPNAVSAALGDYQSRFQSGGDFVPQDIDTSGDQGFEALLRERMAGGGVVGWEEIEKGAYDPYARIMDREASRATDQAVETMISRGMLDSSEAGRHIADIAMELADRKMAKLGELGLQHEQMKQDSINQAIGQFGILEGNKLQAKVTITAANIGAASQIKSAAINAGATVQAASISAQARLQEAGLNARVALTSLQKQMDMSLVEQGIDPQLFSANTPEGQEYRGGVFQRAELLKNEELLLLQMLNRGQWSDTFQGPRP